MTAAGTPRILASRRRLATQSYRPEKLLAAVLQTLFNTTEVRINPSLAPFEIATLMNNGAPPIAELFS